MKPAIPIKEQTAFARQLRKGSIDAEGLLWARLRGSRLAGLKFKRQQPVGSYIVDFVCFSQKIVVEIDGGQHNDDFVAQRDRERTAWLEGQGFRVIRFWNNDVMGNMDGVLEAISGGSEVAGSPSLQLSPTRGERRKPPHLGENPGGRND